MRSGSMSYLVLDRLHSPGCGPGPITISCTGTQRMRKTKTEGDQTRPFEVLHSLPNSKTIGRSLERFGHSIAGCGHSPDIAGSVGRGGNSRQLSLASAYDKRACCGNCGLRKDTRSLPGCRYAGRYWRRRSLFTNLALMLQPLLVR
jgi:hypothetical protein